MTLFATSTGPAPSRAEESRRRRALAAALRTPRYEILPVDGAAEQAEQHIPRDIPVTVTASARRGLEPTVALAQQLTRRGFRAVPHLSARLVLDEAHLTDIVHRTQDSGIRDVFVVAGDGPPAGSFADSLELLSVIARLRRSGVGVGLEQIGIAGYPEGHPLIGEQALTEALRSKAGLSTYLVTQMCFDAHAVSAWIDRTRASGIQLPVQVGVVGAVDRAKLMRIAWHIGVGPSARFLRRHRSRFARMLLPGGYRPDRLVDDVSADLAQPARGVAGLHVYTLGDIAATERWRQRALERLTGTLPT